MHTGSTFNGRNAVSLQHLHSHRSGFKPLTVNSPSLCKFLHDRRPVLITTQSEPSFHLPLFHICTLRKYLEKTEQYQLYEA